MEFAARIARMHNGYLCKKVSKDCIRSVALTGTLKEVMDADVSRGRQYATRFLNVPEYPVSQPSDPKRQQPVGGVFLNALRGRTSAKARAACGYTDDSIENIRKGI